MDIQEKALKRLIVDIGIEFGEPTDDEHAASDPVTKQYDIPYQDTEHISIYELTYPIESARALRLQILEMFKKQ